MQGQADKEMPPPPEQSEGAFFEEQVADYVRTCNEIVFAALGSIEELMRECGE